MTRQLRRHWFVTVVVVAFLPVLGIFTLASPPTQDIGTWQVLGPMLDSRAGATATRLDDGRVLVVGGQNATGLLRTAEVIAADGSTSAVPNLATARAFHTATLLKDGRVLVTGGMTVNDATASAEIFNPESGSWTAASMLEPRAHHTATIVESGAVVIAGGERGGVASGTVEVFDPAASAFYGLPALSGPRTFHAAASIGGSGVLVMGGTDGAHVFATTEIIDATAGTITSGPAMNGARKNFTATSMLNGDVLVAGGSDGAKDLSSAERYSAGGWSAVGDLRIARQGHAALRLPENAGVLVVGGTAADVPMIGAELFRPTGVTFVQTGATFTGHAAGGLAAGAAPGQAMVAGGTGTASVERYAYATIRTDRDDYAPGETVTITGTGWVPGEEVTLRLVEAPYLDAHPLVSVHADANGNIISTEFAPDEHDLNIRFYLTASGSMSEAQNTFTDSISLDSVTVGAQSGSITAGTSGSAAYAVCVDYHGSNSTISFTVPSGLPTGATASFSPASANNPPECPTTATTLTVTTTAAVATGSYTFTVQATGGGTVTNTGTLLVTNPAPTTTSISPASKSYGDASFPMTVNGTGFNSNSVVRFAGSNRTTTFVSTTQLTATIPASDLLSLGNSNVTVFNPAPGGGTSNPQIFTVNKATATVVVTPYTVTYDGQAHTATVTSITGVNGETGATVGTVNVSNTTHTAAGTYASDTWSFTGAANYNNIASTTITDTINKATATVAVTPYSVTYNGQPHTATVTSITGVNGETGATVGTVTLNTTHTNAGTYASDSWSFTGTGNYNDIASTTITDTINKATAAVVVTPYTVTYNGQSHTATVTSITGVNGETGATVGTVDVSNTTHTNAATYATDTWSFTGTANYNNQGPTTITDTIGKANATFTVTPYTVTYNGQSHTATVSAIAGVNGETGATVGTVDVSNTTHTGAGTYATDTWSFTGTANYNNQGPTTITDTIGKADATFTVTPYTVTYNGQSHTATVSAIAGVNGETGATVGTVDVSNTTHTGAGTYATDTWSFTGTANYNNQGPTTITDTIGKADATFTVTPYNVTYNGSAHTATVSAITGVNGETGATVGTVDVSNTTHTGAGTYATDTWSFTGTANYNNQGPTTITDTIGKADATFTVTPYNVTYDGSAHTATVSAITGVNGETGATVGTVDVSNTTHTGAGTYATDTWSFSGTANYNNQGPTTITDTIGKADATFTVTPYSVTYNGSAHTATVSAITGVNGETGATVGTVDVSNTTHTNAATYASDTWSFTGTANYNNQGPTTITDTIGKADATFTVTPYNVTYNGSAHTAAVSAITGVNGETGATVGTVDVSNTTHTGAGSFTTDSWSFTGTANYNNQGPTTITDTIGKADATFTVTPYNVTYNGSAHTAAVSAITGVNGETGATVGAVDVSNTTHTNAGSFTTDSWNFTGTANYNNQGPTTITDTIGKADATFTVTPYTVTYNGQSHTATVSAIAGVNGETGATVGTVDVSNTTHTGAGTYATDTWSFTGTANYNNQGPTTITDTIGKADATFTVTPYNVTYNGSAHTATVSAITGVNGETGATVGTVDVSNTTHTGAGTYATDTWSFTGTANYNNQGPTTITDTIGKADATFTVTPYNVTYDGSAHTATVSAITGVNGETGATVGTVDVSNTTHTGAGTYATDTWSFSGTANYNNQGPTTITDTIGKADATFTVTPYTVTYNGQSHTATVSAITGVNGETGATVGTVDVSNTTHTNAATYASDTWSFTGTANYNNQGPTTITDTIGKADATFTVTPYNVTYNGSAHTAAVSAITGVNGETGATVGTVDVSNTTHTGAGSFTTDSWSFTGTANYNNQGPTTITDTIGKADATFTVTPYNVTYNGSAHTATVSAITGVNGETGATVGAVDVSNTTHTNAGSFTTDSWNFTGTANYNNQGPTTITDTIGKADATFTVTPYTVTYNGQSHTATVSAIAGVNGETGATVGTVDVSNTTHTGAGTYATDTWSFTGTANYNNQGPTTITDTIGKADATFTVTPYNVTYNGSAHTATVSAITGVNGETGATVGTVDVSNTTHTGAGTYATDTWSFTGTANYNNQGPTTITDTIGKADATFTVTPYNVTYDGSAHTATVSAITGVNGETGATVGTVDVSNTTHTGAGTYATDTWSFSGTANYNNQGPTTITDTIGKADATFTVTPYNVTYNGSAHTATVSAITGVNGETGATVGTVDVSNTTHTNAATYASDTWSFTGTANYNNQGPTTITDTIGKADATFTVTPYNVTYNGSAHTAAVSAITGVNGETGATVGTVDVSNTTHTGAGSFTTDSWSFTGTANYNNQGPTTITDTIGKADATFTVTPYNVTYNGSAHTAAVSAITGVNGETGATVGAVDVSNTTHTGAGTYATDSWSFTGTANYNNQGPTTITDTIGKADAAFTVTPYTVTYNGQSHTATVSAITGVNGETGATVGSVDVSNTTHTNAGSFTTDSWSFTGTANYNNQGPTTITDTIGKADATFTVTPYSGTYSGSAHTASVSAITGVNGETGATVGTVDVSNTTHTGAGTYATDSWSFTGTANYNNQGPTTITDTIGKADATFTVTPYNVTYNGSAHTAAVSAITGVNGETGATVGTVDVSNTTHTGAGSFTTDSWNFTGTANYNNQGPTTITDTIGKADATFTVTPYSVTYNGSAQTATVSAITGVNGETGATVGTVDVSNTTHTNAGSFTTDSWSFTGTANYNNQGPTTITDTIGKADATFTVTPYTVTYSGQSHTATVSAITGVNGETGATVGTVDVSNTTHTNAATYATDSWSFTGAANYNNLGPTTITDTIGKADATFTVTAYNVTYNGSAHTASVSTITGVNGETGATVGTVDVSNTTHTNAATYATDTWTFSGAANYKNIASTPIIDTINKANPSVVVTPYNVQWDGQDHTATYTIAGVNGETGAAVGTVTLHTTHKLVGTYSLDTWSFTGAANYNSIANTTITDAITTGYCFNGFLSPIGGSVESSNGGSFANPLKAFKLNSTIPVKFVLNSRNGTACGAVVTVGIHALQAVKYSSAVDSDPPIDATPTDAATSGNLFRLTDSEWHFNLSTKGLSAGTWLLQATLEDGSTRAVWITIKK